jgi:hypothetical protein
MRERCSLCPFELLEGLVANVAELSECNLGDAGALVASWEECAEPEPVWAVFRYLLSYLGEGRVLVDKSP